MCNQPSADKECLSKVTADDDTSSEHEEGAHNCMWKPQTQCACGSVDGGCIPKKWSSVTMSTQTNSVDKSNYRLNQLLL